MRAVIPTDETAEQKKARRRAYYLRNVAKHGAKYKAAKRARYLQTAAQQIARVKAWRKANPERVKANARLASKRNAARNLAAKRRRAGIPQPPYPKPSACECCHIVPSTGRLVVDHDHISGKFRGWVCFKCNVGIGLFRDNVQFLRRATNYLLRAQGAR